MNTSTAFSRAYLAISVPEQGTAETDRGRSRAAHAASKGPGIRGGELLGRARRERKHETRTTEAGCAIHLGSLHESFPGLPGCAFLVPREAYSAPRVAALIFRRYRIVTVSSLSDVVAPEKFTPQTFLARPSCTKSSNTALNLLDISGPAELGTSRPYNCAKRRELRMGLRELAEVA